MEHPTPTITALPEEPEAPKDSQRVPQQETRPERKPGGRRGPHKPARPPKPPLPGLPDDMEEMPQMEDD